MRIAGSALTAVPRTGYRQAMAHDGNSTVLVEEPAEGIILVRIDRPEKRNALDLETVCALFDTFERLDRDASVRCIVVTGTDDYFAAGVDLAELAGASVIDVYLAAESVRWERLRQIRTPLIAAVAGFCLGGGCELAMACDIIVAAKNAVFAFPEAKVGIIPGAGGTQRFTRAVGKSRAMEHILTGRPFKAPEAEQWGLVSRVTSPRSLLDEALEIAKEIAAGSPLAVRLAKDAVNKAWDTTLEVGLAYERENFLLSLATEDRTEGVAAFLDKREPEFKGR
jgi:enoyl-CoA hydratase